MIWITNIFAKLNLRETKVSISLATMQLKVEGEITCVMLTEQGALLDGYDDAGFHKYGAGQLLNRLAASLLGRLGEG